MTAPMTEPMIEPWTPRTIRWPVRVGLGLARSVILLVACALYPAVITLGVVLVQLWVSHSGGPQWKLVVQFAAAGCVLIIFAPSGEICRLLRWLVRRWTGITVPDGYRPTSSMVRMATGYWWNGYRYVRNRRMARARRWLRRQERDPAAWRHRLVLLVAPLAVGVVAVLPVAGIGAGITALAAIDSPVRLVGLPALAVGIGTAPHAWRVAVAVLIRLLRPTSAAALSERVARLTEQRADATAAQVAEISRIERDLHDGAQARLVALGLTLTTAQRAVDHDSERVKALLREATTNTTLALRELRALVRGIYPPVLSERGLLDALRALALDTPLPVSVRAGPGFDTRLDLPIESALYFGTAELLTNAVKHAKATRATVRLWRKPDTVVIEVADDGCGNAVASAGGGLAGLRRRLAVFDGTLVLDSPAGGPTNARMVVPWTSS